MAEPAFPTADDPTCAAPWAATRASPAGPPAAAAALDPPAAADPLAAAPPGAAAGGAMAATGEAEPAPEGDSDGPPLTLAEPDDPLGPGLGPRSRDIMRACSMPPAPAGPLRPRMPMA